MIIVRSIGYHGRQFARLRRAADPVIKRLHPTAT